MAEKATREVAPAAASIPQEPAENLGTELLLAGQEGNAPPPPERVPVDDLGLDELLGVDGQSAYAAGDAGPETVSRKTAR